MSEVYESEGYRVWKEILIEIMGEVATCVVERKVKEKLEQKKKLRRNREIPSNPYLL